MFPPLGLSTIAAKPIPLTVSPRQVILRHRLRRANDPFNHSVLRNLSRKLAGWHSFSTYKFRVVPEWRQSSMSACDRMFGSCLILMQLQDFYDNFKLASDLNNDEKLNWVEQTLWLAECFLQQFGELVPFLTNDFIEAILDVGPTNPKLRTALSLMRLLIEAYSVKSGGAIRDAQSELLRVPTETFVELLVYTVTPLYRYGRQLKDATDALGNECCELDMEYLANTLYKVMGSNVPFCGAAGMLCRRVGDERDFQRQVTVGMVIGSGLATLAFWPIGVAGLILSGIPGIGWYRKAQEYTNVEEMGKFGQEVDLLGSCCKTYMLLVVTRAGSFFDRGTPQYESYERLLREIYGVDVSSEDFRINDLLKSKGLEIFQKVDATRLMVHKHGKDYGVKTSMEE
ncbi:hypothetical protein NCS55_00873300 [Fusarium keratoplasticum]|nr:hypothetical protein NCS55_00873300 [Fusarium keratoplasticum]